jgi:hypothetical protein
MENSWLFPALEVLHLIGVALYLGPVFLGDLSVLGAIPRVTVPIPRFALVLVLLSGALLFIANPARYSQNPAFLLKLALLIGVATIRSRGKWSLALWALLILTSRAVIDFDV